MFSVWCIVKNEKIIIHKDGSKEPSILKIKMIASKNWNVTELSSLLSEVISVN